MKKLLIFLMFISWIQFSLAESEGEYLEKHVHTINLNAYDAENFKFLDDDRTSRVFFSGEYHGYEENYLIRMQLIRYFYEEHGIRRYMGELGASSGYFLNKYLETGEMKYLDIVNYSLEGSYDFSRDDYNFWRGLYEYNTSLPEGKKIKIYGLDMELQYWIPLLAVHDILSRLDPSDVAEADRENYTEARKLFREVNDTLLPPGMDPKDIYSNIVKVTEEKKLRYRRGEIINAFKTSRMNLVLGRASLEKYFTPEEMIEIEAIIFNALNTLEFLRLQANEEISFYMRERFIFENFIRLFKAFPEDDFYGQWGRFHISGRSGSSEVRFAQLVEDFAPSFYKSISAVELIYNDKKHPDYKKKDMRDKLKTLSKYIPKGSGAVIFDLRNLPKESSLLDEKERRSIKYIIVINSPNKVESLK